MFLWSETNTEPHSELLCGQSEPGQVHIQTRQYSELYPAVPRHHQVHLLYRHSWSPGTIPPDVLVTTLKPDLVIIDKKQKSIYIFELTVPGEMRIITAHKLKLEKYQHFQTDINTLKVSVHPFEIGSHTGYISRENKETLSSLHKFCKKDIKLKDFKNNISAITILGSYFIFNNRNNETWHTPSYISNPM